MTSDLLVSSALVAAGALLVWVGVLWLRVTRLGAPLQEVSDSIIQADDQLQAAVAAQHDLAISIEVLNPLELAREHSRLAGSLAAIAPNRVRRRVYDTVVRELREELAERGVQARIEIHRGRPSS